MKTIKTYIYNTIIIFISILVTLFLFDLLLHYTNYKSLIKKEVYPRFYLVKDPETGFDISKNALVQNHTFFDLSYDIWSNNFGCFDNEYRGEWDVIYLTGDSFTWGFAPFEDKWGTKIESYLGIRTIKCGVGGYGTKQEFIKTTRDLKNLPVPKLIVLGYTEGNDIDDDANFPNGSVFNGYSVRNLAKNGLSESDAEAKYALYDKYCTIEPPQNPKFQEIKCWFNNNSIFYNLVKNNVRQLFIKILPDSVLKKSGLVVEEKEVVHIVPDDTQYKKHLENIKSFKKLSDKIGSKFVMVLIPGNNEKLKPFLDKEKIHYIDLKDSFESYGKIKKLRWNVDGHWNVTGNHLAGALVTKYLIENNLVDIPNKKDVLLKIDKDLIRDFGTSTISN